MKRRIIFRTILLTALMAAGALAMHAIHSRANAADLGGTCCADLEERVSELEATTARKGNRKVTLTISGEVTKGMLWAKDAYQGVVDGNEVSSTRLRFDGMGRITGDVTAGYVLEIGLVDPVTGIDDLYVRQSAWWLQSAKYGRLMVGKTGNAAYGITQINTANTNVIAVNTTGLDGDLANVVRYDSITYHGFAFAASLSNDQDKAFAVTWAGAFGDFRVAAGLGRAETLGVARTVGSASVMHVPTGIFATTAMGHVDDGSAAYHMTAGVEKLYQPIGKTTLYAEFAHADSLVLGSGWGGIAMGDRLWGFGAVQAVNAAGMDVFAGYRNNDGDSQVMLGARIKF